MGVISLCQRKMSGRKTGVCYCFIFPLDFGLRLNCCAASISKTAIDFPGDREVQLSAGAWLFSWAERKNNGPFVLISLHNTCPNQCGMVQWVDLHRWEITPEKECCGAIQKWNLESEQKCGDDKRTFCQSDN